MTNDLPSLASLDFISYLDTEGKIPNLVQGKIGAYAIFDRDRALQYVGYSRDISLSLKQHLVRRPQQCYWLKFQSIERPNRTLLDELRSAWIAENGSLPEGNGGEATLWNDPIDVKTMMTAEERVSYQALELDELAKEKFLKTVARRVEAEILAVLKDRGVTEEIRFNPKLKTSGLLDLK